MNRKSSIDVFSYANYRQYMSDYYEERKKSAHGYSYRQFAQKGGFSSPSFLKEVIEGERNLTPTATEQCLVALSLAGKQADYFRALVSFNQAKNDAEREQHFAQMQKLRPKAKRYKEEADGVEFVQHWIYAVIQQWIQTEGFRDEPLWVKNRLEGQADLKDIAAALSFLKRAGFIQKGEDGKFYANDDVIIGSDEVRNLAIRGYYRSVLDQAKQMLEILPLEQREYGALVFHMPQEDLPDLKKKLKDIIADLHHWTLQRQKKSGVVVQFNLQMYTQTKKD